MRRGCSRTRSSSFFASRFASSRAAFSPVTLRSLRPRTSPLSCTPARRHLAAAAVSAHPSDTRSLFPWALVAGLASATLSAASLFFSDSFSPRVARADSIASRGEQIHDDSPEELGPDELEREVQFGHGHVSFSVFSAKFVIFAGTSHFSLASEVAALLDVPLGEADIGHFVDGETSIKILESVRGKDVYIVQPTAMPINDNLMELLLLVSTLRRASARNVTAIIPYYGYSRQDRIREGRETIGAADVAMMLEACGVDRVVSVDLHRGQIEGFFSSSTPVENLDAMSIAVPWFLQLDLDDPVIVCPSSSGIHRAKNFRDYMLREGVSTRLAFVTPVNPEGIVDDETLHHHRISESQELVGDVKHSDVVIVDDMIDTGSRVVTAAKTVKAAGADRVYAYTTHPILSAGALEAIENSPIDMLIVANTIPQHDNVRHTRKIKIVSVAPLIAEAIRRMQIQQSLTILTEAGAPGQS